MHKYQYNSKNKQIARNLRKRQTDAEGMLWKYIRNRQLKGLKFRRQFPVLNYVLDFYCIETKLAIKLDGGQHASRETKEYDAQRSKDLEQLGIKVLRFWNNDVLENIEGVAQRIEEVCTDLDEGDSTSEEIAASPFSCEEKDRMRSVSAGDGVENVTTKDSGVTSPLLRQGFEGQAQSSPTRRGRRAVEERRLRTFIKESRKLVIIGCGNPMRGDDGVGPYIIQNLKFKIQNNDPSEQASKGAKQGEIIQDSRFKILDSKIVLINTETVLENFIGKVIKEKPSHVLIIDAAVMEGKKPGEWFLIEPVRMESEFHSTHSMPISLFCELVAKETGCSIMGLGIVPELVDVGEGLTAEVKKGGQEIAGIVGESAIGE